MYTGMEKDGFGDRVNVLIVSIKCPVSVYTDFNPETSNMLFIFISPSFSFSPSNSDSLTCGVHIRLSSWY